MVTRDLLSISDLNENELNQLLLSADTLKTGGADRSMDGRILTTVFEKPSLRTKASLELAAKLLGGHVLSFGAHEVQIGEREPIEDVARVISRMSDVLAMRVFQHETLVSASHASDIPILNALSDFEHPCQALADLLTLRERFGELAGLRVAFIGDGFNVACSLAFAAVKSGIHLTIASPEGYSIPGDIITKINNTSGPGNLTLVSDPREAVSGAAAVYTDVWASMGQESESVTRKEAFAAYQVNSELLDFAPSDVVVMHDLPAHRGEEITAEVFEKNQNMIFDQAENRLYTAQAALKYTLGLDQ